MFKNKTNGSNIDSRTNSINENNNCKTRRDPNDSKDTIQDFGDEKMKICWKAALPQILAVCAKNTLIFTLAASSSVTTIAVPALSADEHLVEDEYLSLDKSQISWISSMSNMALPLGCLFSGVLTQPFGRKRSMIVCNIPILISNFLLCYGTTVPCLYVALVIQGLTTGIVLSPVMTYVAEVTQPNIRGPLCAISSVTYVVGMVSQYFFGAFLNWRTVAAINNVFSVMAAVSLIFVPESPYWLISKNRKKDAERSLCWLRGWVKPDKIQIELDQLIQDIANSKEKQIDKGIQMSTYKLYLRRSFLLPFFLVLSGFFFYHVGGMTPITSYAVSIFDTLKVPLDPFIATLLFGLFEVIGVIICSIAVYHVGKRPLTLVSAFGSAICFFVLGFYAQFHEYLDWNVPSVPMICILFSAFISHIGLRIIPWIILSEVFPCNIRATAAGVTSSTAYIIGFLITKTYYTLLDWLSLYGLFYVFGIVNLIAYLLYYTMLPETEGVLLYDIETHFADKTKTFVTKIQSRKINKEDNTIKYGLDNLGVDVTT